MVEFEHRDQFEVHETNGQKGHGRLSECRCPSVDETKRFEYKNKEFCKGCLMLIVILMMIMMVMMMIMMMDKIHKS